MSSVVEKALEAMSRWVAHASQCQLGARCVLCSRLRKESNAMLGSAKRFAERRPKMVCVVGIDGAELGELMILREALKSSKTIPINFSTDLGDTGVVPMGGLRFFYIDLCDEVYVYKADQADMKMRVELAYALMIEKSVSWRDQADLFDPVPECEICHVRMSMHFSATGALPEFACSKCLPIKGPKIMLDR